MTGWGPGEQLATYIRVLRGMGLSRGEIKSLHGYGQAGSLTEAKLREAIQSEAGTDRLTPSVFHHQLHRVLARSERGIRSDRRYWNHAPAIQLHEAVSTYDCEFGVRSATGGDRAGWTTDDEPVELGLREPHTGTVRRTSFSYPTTSLGDDNYPALVHAVNERLFADAKLEIVRLSDRLDDWLFVLVESADLDTLVREFGDRITCFGEPLLATHQPADYARDVPDDPSQTASLPPELVPEPDDSGPSVQTLVEERSATFGEVAASVEVNPDGERFDHGERVGPSVDDLASNPETVMTDGAGAAVQTTDDVSRGATDAVETLLAGVSDQVLTDDGETTEPSDAADRPEWLFEGSEPVEAVTGALDEVFDHLHREAALGGVGTAHVDEDRTGSAAVLDMLDHENAGEDSSVEHGFLWVDSSELTASPDAVFDAMTSS